MTAIRKSRYCFLIRQGEIYLAYNSYTNSFFKINKYVYDIIQNTYSEISNDINTNEEIKKLHDMRLLSTKEEDDSIVDLLRMKYLMHSYSKENLAILLVPTLACNLRCPYCFEKNKQPIRMDFDMCEKIIKFIKSHTYAKNMSLTWYGGEPLLAPDIIKYFLSRLSEIETPYLVSHGMVTNGTLLTKKNIDILKKYPLNSIQITLDGLQNTHDKKRIKADGSGTYNLIIKNIKAFIEEYPKTSISLRVNIDRNNYKEFMQVYDFIKTLYPNKKNIYIYPGILRNCGAKVVNSPFLINEDILKIKELFVKEGYPIQYPQTAESGCCATCISSYIIGPKGEIYKCWEDIGYETKSIGNIQEQQYTNVSLLSKYMLHGSHIIDEECKDCPLLPICSEDCAKNRIENKFDNAENTLCSIYKNKNYEALTKMLYNFYNRCILNK